MEEQFKIKLGNLLYDYLNLFVKDEKESFKHFYYRVHDDLSSLITGYICCYCDFVDSYKLHEYLVSIAQKIELNLVEDYYYGK